MRVTWHGEELAREAVPETLVPETGAFWGLRSVVYHDGPVFLWVPLKSTDRFHLSSAPTSKTVRTTRSAPRHRTGPCSVELRSWICSNFCSANSWNFSRTWSVGLERRTAPDGRRNGDRPDRRKRRLPSKRCTGWKLLGARNAARRARGVGGGEDPADVKAPEANHEGKLGRFPLFLGPLGQAGGEGIGRGFPQRIRGREGESKSR